MSVVAAALRELIALGVSGEALVAAVERIEDAAVVERARSVEQAVEIASRKEDAKLAARRAKDAERQRIKRASKETAGVQGNPRTSTDIQGKPPTEAHEASRPHVEDTSLPSLRSEEIVGGGVVGATAIPVSDDWPDGKADHHAKLLIATVASPWLDPDKSPDLVTTRGRIAAWKRDGASWEHDVLPVVTGLCANRRSRVASWKFFDGAISRSIAENRAALEIPEARGNRPTGPPRTIDEKSTASWDYAIAKIAEDDQSENRNH